MAISHRRQTFLRLSKLPQSGKVELVILLLNAGSASTSRSWSDSCAIESALSSRREWKRNRAGRLLPLDGANSVAEVRLSLCFSEFVKPTLCAARHIQLAIRALTLIFSGWVSWLSTASLAEIEGLWDSWMPLHLFIFFDFSLQSNDASHVAVWKVRPNWGLWGLWKVLFWKESSW